MDVFVRGMAALSGVRDRDTLDAALVQTVLQTVAAAGGMEATLIRVVGEPDDRRCLVHARQREGSPAIDRDCVWRDWTELARLNDHPLQAAVFAGGVSPVFSESEGLTVFAVVSEQGPWGILEIRARQPLESSIQRLVSALVETYQNVLNLLDYGERDALTELLNRKTFDGAFFKATTPQHPVEIADERRVADGVGSYWLAVLDIDHFKRVNDTYGHLIGDEVLLLVARIMRNSFRFHDQLYRFGGEEFVILMRCRDVLDARHALERLRINVESYVFPQVGHITVSVGYSGLHPHDTPGAAFGRADKAVYHAKSHGRNQVVNYEDLVQSGAVEEKTDDMDVDLF